MKAISLAVDVVKVEQKKEDTSVTGDFVRGGELQYIPGCAGLGCRNVLVEDAFV